MSVLSRALRCFSRSVSPPKHLLRATTCTLLLLGTLAVVLACRWRDSRMATATGRETDRMVLSVSMVLGSNGQFLLLDFRPPAIHISCCYKYTNDLEIRQA